MITLYRPGAGAVELCRSGVQLGLALLIQSTLLLAVGLWIGQRLASRGPSLQSLVYRSTLAAVAMGGVLSLLLAGAIQPFWSLTLPSAEAPVVGRAAVPIVSPAPALTRMGSQAASSFAPFAPDVSDPQAFSPARGFPEPRFNPNGWLYVGAAGLWGGGAILLLGWLVISHLWIGRLRRGSVPIRDGIAALTLNAACQPMRIRPPALLASRQVQSPFLIGVWQPAILLPAGYEAEFDAPALRAILIHELTHMVRRDCAWRLLARLVGALIWPQPLLWLLSRRLAQVGEEVCDQAVLQGEVNPHAYAACLLRLAERVVSPWPERAAGLGVVPFRSSLGRRIEQILDGSRRRTLSVAFPLRVAVALGAAASVIGGLTLVSSAAPRPFSPRKARQMTKAEEKPVGGPVSGRVVTPDGKPVSGATVSWVSRTDDAQALLASVTTDAEGRFRFTDTTPLRHKNDFPQLLVEAGRWGLAFQKIPEGRETAEISVVPATELRARFLDPAGQPVPKLKISPLLLVGGRSSFFRFPAALAQRYTRLSDRLGNVTLTNLPQGFSLQLAVGDDRFARLGYRGRIQLAHSAVTEADSIHLQPGASINGRITVGAAGKPGAAIKVFAQGMGPEEGWGEGTADVRGEYHITQLPPGAYNVALGLHGPVAQLWTAKAHEGVSVHLGERLDGVDFELIPGAVIRGRVMAADNGEPVPGVSVGVYGPAHPPSGAAVQGTETGQDGTYLHRVPAGKQHLYVAMATPPSGYLLPANSSRDLTLRDGETVTVDFKLPRGVPVKPAHGRVVGPDGKPVAKAQVMLFTSEPGGDDSLTADADGAFKVGEQLLSRTVTLRARQGDLATPAGRIVTSGQEVLLHLQKNVEVSVSGRVTTVGGEPIAGAAVSLIAWAYDRGSGSVVARTDQAGRYILPNLWPDFRYSVDATTNGFGHKSTERVQLQPGESRELPPLVLKVADQSIAGRVVDEQGEPVAGAQVNLNGQESAQEMKATDGEGRFRFDVVDEKLSVQAYRAGYQWSHKDTHAGNTDLILVLIKEGATRAANDGTREQEQFQRRRGQPAPPLHSVAWVNSAPLTMPKLRGKVVLIDFWGIGCGPCVASLPGVQRTADEFSRRGVVVIGLHNAGTPRTELQAFARKHGLTYPLAIDAADDQGPSFGKTFRQYGVQGIPSVAVIDRTGRVAYLGNFLDEAIGTLGPLLGQSN